jgi:2,4-diketo-3-deoxy-L-fuconate hydrolase
MRLARLIYDGTARIGVVENDHVAVMPSSFGGMVDLIRNADEAMALLQAAMKSAPRIPLAEAALLAPIDRYRRDIICTGWNYWTHFEESIGKREGQEVDRPKAPTFFTKGPDVAIGPLDDIAYDPRISNKWDYEAEIAVVIGKRGRSIATKDAPGHVFGFTLANDISQRDLQRRHGSQWLKGKSIDATMPLGPFIVTPDEIDLPNVRLQCLVNGEIMQDAPAGQMAFNVAELIAELSFGMTLEPGDVILTGTPAGVGNAREPPVFLKSGDVVTTRATGLGEMTNRLVATDLHGSSNVVIGEATD